MIFEAFLLCFFSWVAIPIIQKITEKKTFELPKGMYCLPLFIYLAIQNWPKLITFLDANF